MKRLRRYYSQNTPLKTKDICSRIEDSNNFLKGDNSSYGGQLYNSALLNKIIQRKTSDNKIELSENAGLGGAFELMGELTIDEIKDNQTLISVKLQMGIFPLITPYILIIIFAIAGSFLIFINLILALIVYGFFIISLSFYMITNLRVKRFLKKIEAALDLNYNWSDNY